MQQAWVVIIACSSSTRPSQSSASPSPGPQLLNKKEITSVTLVPTPLRDPVVSQLAVQVALLALASPFVLEASSPLSAFTALSLIILADELALAFLVVAVGRSIASSILVVSTVVLVLPVLVNFLLHDLKMLNLFKLTRVCDCICGGSYQNEMWRYGGGYSILRSNQVHRICSFAGLGLFLLEVAVNVVLRRVLSAEGGRLDGVRRQNGVAEARLYFSKGVVWIWRRGVLDWWLLEGKTLADWHRHFWL